MRRILIILVLALTASLGVSAASPRWEGIDVLPSQVVESLRPASSPAPQGVVYTVHDSYIYIYSPAPVQVKVFTILGQLISQETLAQGSHRLRMNSRGIYLLKVGESTLRVTI